VRQDRQNVVTENIHVEEHSHFRFLSDGTRLRLQTITNAVAPFDRQGLSREVVSATSRQLSQVLHRHRGRLVQCDGVAITCFWKASLMPSSAPAVPIGDVVFVLFRGLITGDDVTFYGRLGEGEYQQ
jgi:hypothetical protein